MRGCLVALCLLGFVSSAGAQEFDLPTLRGSSPFIPAAPTYTRWAGFYVGGQVGYSSVNVDFKDATQDLIAYLLRETALENEKHPSEWGVLGKGHAAGASYGVFVGYNWQWDNVILGVDFHYNRSGGLFASAPVSPISRSVNAGGLQYLLTVDGDASMRITDYGAARFRAGWIAGNFLPYATAGLALGRADIIRSARVFGVENPPAGYPDVPCDPLAGCTEFDFASSSSKKAAFIYGWSAGVGLDVLVMPNVFLRGEYEFISFTQIQNIKAQMNTARVGAAVRF